MSQLLEEFTKRSNTQQLKIYCVGDAMLDEYYKVKVERISPEAPIAVMHSEDGDLIHRPGGVANVAWQYKNFNVDAKVFCLNDPDKIKFFESSGLDCYTLGHPRAQLPIKRRFVSGAHQIARHDQENTNCKLSDADIAYAVKFLSDLSNNGYVDEPDVVIYSDYNKGLFSQDFTVSGCFKKSKAITVVDPKTKPIEKWQFCTVFKPNAKEAFELTGLSNWEDQVRQLQKMTHAQAVVVTFGGGRVGGYSTIHQKTFSFEPKKSVPVQSVIGAGDCFSAFLGLAMGHRFTIQESVEIAWSAGAAYVQNRFNEPITYEELVS